MVEANPPADRRHDPLRYAAEMIERAEVPKFPYAPNPRREWLSAIMAGLVVAFGLAFGIEYLDDTVKTPEDITRRLKLPLLGLVPAVRGERVPVLTETVPHDFGEAFRSLRTSLVFTSGSQSTRIIAVTSSQPLEGKTTTAVGARTGKFIWRTRQGAFNPVVSDGRGMFLVGSTDLFALTPKKKRKHRR